MQRLGSASGKIILTGEYAVVFGFSGIAVPAPLRVDVGFEEREHEGDLNIVWEGSEVDRRWIEYAQRIGALCGSFAGTLTIRNAIPLGKGMGSSTAIVVAIARCLLGRDCRDAALKIEDAVNPGHSGLDFEVIWNEKPLHFQKNNGSNAVNIRSDILENIRLLDTGMPNGSTPDMVAWVCRRKDDPVVAKALEAIGRCSNRLLRGEDLKAIIRDHHRAQVALGVVPKAVQELIAGIEQKGGAAKVLGAGGRSDLASSSAVRGGVGGGIVLAFFGEPFATRYPDLL